LTYALTTRALEALHVVAASLGKAKCVVISGVSTPKPVYHTRRSVVNGTNVPTLDHEAVFS